MPQCFVVLVMSVAVKLNAPLTRLYRLGFVYTEPCMHCTLADKQLGQNAEP